MSNQRHIGDQHVKNVVRACNQQLRNQPIDSASEITLETVKYIFSRFPNVSRIKSKFDFENSDEHPDLIIEEENRRRHEVNLFLVKGTSAIQPKNLGAKSFFTKYFLSHELQKRFNQHIEQEYELFLKRAMDIHGEEIDVKIVKKDVKEKYPRFSEEIEPFRKSFLFELREYGFYLLREEYSSEVEKTKHAFDQLLMRSTENIVTRHVGGNKCLCVQSFESKADLDEELHIYKKGQNSIGIRAGEEALLLRFKFESGPTSSIKLATSFETFSYEEDVLQENQRMMKRFEKIIAQHTHVEKKNKSNAIGKVNEAAVYYEFVKQQPSIYQVDSNEGVSTLEDFVSYVSKSELDQILTAAKGTVQSIVNHLQRKFSGYQLDSVQLAAGSYLKNRLDTSDMKVVIVKGTDYEEENLSLKALAKKSARVTSKNPGAGQILGQQYFDVGDLKGLIEDVKQQFEQGHYTHQACLEKVSEEIGSTLENATQEKLRTGLQALLGQSTVVITFYKVSKSMVLEHEHIGSHIRVFKHTPSTIQTTLQWNDGHEELSLRVKFSASQKRGWSSLKLACDYMILR